MRLRVIGTQLDGAQQVVLRFVEFSLLEENQSEVRVQDEYAGVLADEPAVDDFRFGEGVGLEVDETEEIEDVGIIRAHALRRFELAPSLGVSSLRERLAAAVVMEEEDALIERRSDSRIAFRH